LKKRGDDLGLIYSELPAVADGVFTQNAVKAAPVILSKQHLKQDMMAQAVIANSGCANCCTGQRGMRDAATMAELAGKDLGLKKEDVLVASTGVIGTFLDIKKIRQAIPGLVKGLSAGGSPDFARAVMTTDTFPKEIAVKFNIGQKEVAIGAVAKGAGMIHPNMATMLCFITTDIYITRRALKLALEEAVNRSFNAISIDGETSTNDCVLILANGASGNDLIDKTGGGFTRFCEALNRVTEDLARMIVRDGEGATKFVEIVVKGAPSHWQGVKVGRRIASSTLFKTCVYGGDPNWGRVVASLGAAGIRIREDSFDVYLGGQQVVKNGLAQNVNRENLRKVFKAKEIVVTVDLKLGKDTARVWTCDLTEKYIEINSEYST
ncbi:MAG: bifunctional glutamate N-acetyltransferase/amino-acid acetyltransferase ArgJ, partial [Candidatus Omnitrophica bacterium]|nr:bifunctional glutamate N-acetyltransferase/amino-acid acetyltransferase ArgJ [Candidatus Omnitrophota bacterium]